MWKPLENSYNRVLYFNGEIEMRELMKIIEKEKVGRGFCHGERERERELVMHSPFLPCVLTPSPTPSFFNSCRGGHVSLFYWVRCCLPIRK